MTDSPTEELLINEHVSIFNTLVLIFSLCLRVKCSLHQGNASPGFIIMTYSESLVIRLREAECQFPPNLSYSLTSVTAC